MIESTSKKFCQNNNDILVVEAIKSFYRKNFCTREYLDNLIKDGKLEYGKKKMYSTIDHIITSSITELHLKKIDSYFKEDDISHNDINSIFLNLFSYLYNMIDKNNRVNRFNSNNFLIRDLRLFSNNSDNILFYIINVIESVWVFVLLYFLLANSLEINIEGLDLHKTVFFENAISMIIEEWILIQNSSLNKKKIDINYVKIKIKAFDKKLLKELFNSLNFLNIEITKILDLKNIEYIIISKIDSFKVQLSNIFQKKSVINLMSDTSVKKGKNTTTLKFYVVDQVDKILQDDINILVENLQKFWLFNIRGIFKDEYKYVLDKKEEIFLKKEYSLRDCYRTCIWVLNDDNNDISIKKFKDSKVFFYKIDDKNNKNSGKEIFSDVYKKVLSNNSDVENKFIFTSILNFNVSIKERLFNKIIRSDSIFQHVEYTQNESDISDKDKNSRLVSVPLSSSKFFENMFGFNEILIDILKNFEMKFDLKKYMDTQILTLIQEILDVQSDSELPFYQKSIKKIAFEIKKQSDISDDIKNGLLEMLEIKIQYIKLKNSEIIDEIIVFFINKIFKSEQSNDNLKKKYNKEILEFFMKFMKFVMQNAKFDELIIINITNQELDYPMFNYLKLPNFINNDNNFLIDISYVMYQIIAEVNNFILENVPLYKLEDPIKVKRVKVKKRKILEEESTISMLHMSNISKISNRSDKHSRT